MYWNEMSYNKYKKRNQFDRMHFEFDDEYDYFDIDNEYIDCDLVNDNYDKIYNSLEVE